MKALIISDIYSEFRPNDWLYFSDLSTYDIVICAGDVAQGIRGVQFLQNSFPNKQVLYVPGNHEYYNYSTSIISQIRKAANGSNVHVMDRDKIQIDGQWFIGATLWTDLQLCNDDGEHTIRGINDFRAIKGMTKDYWFREHLHSLMWIHESLKEHEDAVLITHHFPMQSISDRYKGNLINSGFASDLENVFLREPKLWVHGHTHDFCDYTYLGTRVVCNPLGYPREGEEPHAFIVET